MAKGYPPLKDTGAQERLASENSDELSENGMGSLSGGKVETRLKICEFRALEKRAAF